MRINSLKRVELDVSKVHLGRVAARRPEVSVAQLRTLVRGRRRRLDRHRRSGSGAALSAVDPDEGRRARRRTRRRRTRRRDVPRLDRLEPARQLAALSAASVERLPAQRRSDDARHLDDDEDPAVDTTTTKSAGLRREPPVLGLLLIFHHVRRLRLLPLRYCCGDRSTFVLISTGQRRRRSCLQIKNGIHDIFRKLKALVRVRNVNN